jgi:ABC-type uncharacterized transport system permease subunit
MVADMKPRDFFGVRQYRFPKMLILPILWLIFLDICETIDLFSHANYLQIVSAIIAWCLTIGLLFRSRVAYVLLLVLFPTAILLNIWNVHEPLYSIKTMVLYFGLVTIPLAICFRHFFSKSGKRDQSRGDGVI